jgi:tetratricopeptide (TPR) repeat protein
MINSNRAVNRLPHKFQQAIGCLQRGQLGTARRLCEDILKHQPRHADALHLLGLIALQAGDPRLATEWLGRSLAVDGTSAPAHCNQGSAFQALGDLDRALDCYRRAILLDPGFAEAHFNHGVVEHLLNRPSLAVVSQNAAIALKPDFVAAYYRRGLALQDLDQPEAALASYDQAIRLEPAHAEAYLNRGIVLRHLNRSAAALASYDRALAINPAYVEAHSNRGNALRDLERWDEALASYDAAISIRPDCAEAHCNRGNWFNERNQCEEAVRSYDRALAINDQYVEAHCNRAVALLLAGDLERGWISYEWRHKRHSRQPEAPRWLGVEPLAGRTILLHSEQGFGDTLQFCRYVSRVATLGARVVFEVEATLVSLMTSVDGVSEVIAKGGARPAVDYECPLLSLPRAFKTTLATIPASRQYLHADPGKIARWEALLGEKARPRVGLVWAGSVLHKHNNRTFELARLLPTLPSGFSYFSLQKEMTPPDKEILARHGDVADCSAALEDFGDTAALCECMDVVVSIDTSVAHLSAALGRSTCILLPFNPDWRWLLNRDDSPWYPSVRLFRQPHQDGWDDVFTNLATHLTQTCAPSSGRLNTAQAPLPSS